MSKVKKYPAPDSPKVRIIVLETDEAHPDTHAEKGSFGEVLHSHFQHAGAEHVPALGVDTDIRFVVEDKGGKVPQFEEFEDYQGVLITGSMYDAHADNPWILKLIALMKGGTVPEILIPERSARLIIWNRTMGAPAGSASQRRVFRPSAAMPNAGRRGRPCSDTRLGARPLEG